MVIANVDRHTRRVLWIEDDYYHMKGLVKPLKEQGVEVVSARSVVEAKTQLADWQNFSLILCDLILPYSDTQAVKPERDDSEESDLVENGLSLIEYMTKEIRVTIPVVVLSIVNSEPIVDRLSVNANVHFLSKRGILPVELCRILLETMEKAAIPSKGRLEK